MHATGSGPLGALLILAPLAAIPVFAIVGVPQFAPVVASATDEEDVADLGEAPPLERTAAAATPAPRLTRTADDLFAPPGTGNTPLTPPGTPAQSSRGFADLSASRSEQPARWLPPPEALDQWQLHSDADEGALEPPPATSSGKSPAASRPAAPERTAAAIGSPQNRARTLAAANRRRDSAPDDALNEKVSIDGFDGGLLQAAPADRRAAEAVARERLAGGKLPPAAQAMLGNGQITPEDLARMRQSGLPIPASQSGWQEAAQRLKALGIRQYRLEARIEEARFLFRCALPEAGNPQVTRLFESDAEDPLDAVMHVLQQIDEYQARVADESRP